MIKENDKGLTMETLGRFELNKVHCGDCLELMKELPDKSVDCVITDPPYGVGWNYSQVDDTQDFIKDNAHKWIKMFCEKSHSCAVYCGYKNMFKYPEPEWVFQTIVPAGSGIMKYGFSCSHPVLIYGKSIHKRPDIQIIPHPVSEKCEHPCPKPISFMSWLINAFSKPNDIILDPFSGSGTTGVACAQLGRKFLGFEISQEYCNLANDRIKAAQRGQSLTQYRQGQEVLSFE